MNQTRKTATIKILTTTNKGEMNVQNQNYKTKITKKRLYNYV